MRKETMNKKTSFYLALRKSEKERENIQCQINDLEHTLVNLRCFLEETKKTNWESQIRKLKNKIEGIESKLNTLTTIQNGYCPINNLDIKLVVTVSPYCVNNCQYFSSCLSLVKKTKVKITYMWNDWETYYVSSREECKDETDKSAYDELMKSNEKCVQMGKVCVEKVQ